MPHEETKSDSDEVAKLKHRLSNFETEYGRLSGLSYQPKSPDEVIITTTPKAGTTWVQQICHQIRSAANGGDMSFNEISEVVPWIELAYDQGQDLNSPQYGYDECLPRLFKTHAWKPHCPEGCKVIVVVRDPMDVLLSFYNFFEDWFFPVGAVSIDEFTREFWLARGIPASRMNNASYFHHFLSWYEARNQSNVLFLFYEDLKDDLKTGVRKIANFMSTSKHDFSTDEIINIVTERSSFEYMLEHKDKFDEKLSKLARNKACGLPRDAGMRKTKLITGKVGNGSKTLSDELKDEVLKKWKTIIEPTTGYKSYDELRYATSA